MRTPDDVLNADFRTAPTPEEVEQWQREWQRERTVLEAELAEARRHNDLLRAVAEAARDHLVAIEGEFVNAVPVDTIEFRNNLRGSLWTAIDGGALEKNE